MKQEQLSDLSAFFRGRKILPLPMRDVHASTRETKHFGAITFLLLALTSGYDFTPVFVIVVISLSFFENEA
jgi:hypothetical protein